MSGAPPLPDGWEWVTPKERPYDRVPVRIIPEDAPPRIREGIARKRMMAIEGECPCGGMTHWPPEEPEEVRRTWEGKIRPATHEEHHWRGCLVDGLEEAIAEWERSKKGVRS